MRPAKKKTVRRKPARTRAVARRPAPAEPALPASAEPAQPARETSERHRRLEALLIEAVRGMDEDGVVFLLRQAHLLSSRAAEQRIAQEIAAYEQSRGVVAEEEPQELAPPPVAIDPSPDGKSYFLSLGNIRKALTRAELGLIVKTCIAAQDREAGCRALFRKLGQERSDVLVDAKISGPESRLLHALYDTVLELTRQSRA